MSAAALLLTAPAQPLAALVWAMGGYLLLQALLNLLNAAQVRRAENKPVALLKGAFWGSVVNALYFCAASALLRIWDWIPSIRPGGTLGIEALIGLLIGPLLWYWCALGRGAGLRLFGRGELAGADEAILRAPPGMNYVSWGVLNLALLQPLGRELFLRGAMLPVVQREMAVRALASGAADAQAQAAGWAWAIGATLCSELILRLNVVWLPATLAYCAVMTALFYLTGDAMAGLCAAMVAGFMQSLVLLRLTLQKQRERDRLRQDQ